MTFDLRPYNTFNIKASARNGIVLRDIAQIASIIELKKNNEPVLIIGEGSDILFAEDFDGTVIINRIMGIDIAQDKDNYYVTVGAGENLNNTIKLLLERNIYGLENLALIPGTVGGAPVQNAGAYGCSISDYCNYVEVVDFEKNMLTRILKKDCDFGYRTSLFKKNPNRYLITNLSFIFPKIWSPNLNYKALKNFNFENGASANKIYDLVSSIRKDKLPDPKILGNAGSFFKNPTVSKVIYEKILETYEEVPVFQTSDNQFIKISAAWLIDKCGCKGLKIQKAGTYYKHALIIVNYGDAESSEILHVARYIQSKVKEIFGIKLEPEVRIIGKNGEFYL